MAGKCVPGQASVVYGVFFMYSTEIYASMSVCLGEFVTSRLKENTTLELLGGIDVIFLSSHHYFQS